MHRVPTSLRAAGLAAAALVLLSGCWTSTESGNDAAASTPPAATAPQPPAGAPEPACAAGDGASDSYECVGVTVTGARDAEPTITLADGFGPADALQVADVYEGSGDPVAPGATLTVQYVGVGQASRDIFDSSWLRGAPATFALGQVIPGWQEGMLGMAPGGRRLLVIPSDLAYGPSGTPDGSIAPDETIVFVVDLLEQVPAP